MLALPASVAGWKQRASELGRCRGRTLITTPPSSSTMPHALAPAQADDPALRTQVAAEQLRMVFGHVTAGTLFATAFAMALALHVAEAVPRGLWWAWVALKLAIALPRIL